MGRTLRVLITDSTEEGKRSFRVYPTLGFAPETSLEVGFSGLLLYNAKGDTANRTSEVNAFTFITLKGQYGFWLDHALYGDRWFFLGGMVFAAAGAVSPHFRDFSLADIRPTGGVGLRYFLFPKKDIFLRFDLGVTPGGVGFYIYTGEAF